MTGRPVVLVLRALGLGDFCTGVPALRALRRACPDHEIVLAAPGALGSLVAATGAIDRLLPTPAYVRRPIDRLGWRGRRPAIAVNLHGRGPQSHRALLALRPDRLLAFACPAAEFADGPSWSSDEHEVARWCRLLSGYGVAALPDDLLLAAPTDNGPGLADAGSADAVVLHPGASGPERRWPADRFAEVARALTADGYRVLVTGSADERELAVTVAGAAGLPDENVLAGRTDLTELAAVVARARLVLCGDTGVAHLATAYATPSVVLFGPMRPAWWGPPKLARHVVLWRGPAGLADIPTADVLDAIRECASAGPAGR